MKDAITFFRLPSLISTYGGFTNQPEEKDFLRTALAWNGSVTPRVLPRVAVVSIYAWVVMKLADSFPDVTLPMTPFEYSGVVLGLLLVMRVNAGTERWWEARKIWGSIVNQSRNLAIISATYVSQTSKQRSSILSWIAAWPHVMRDSLRRETSLDEVAKLVGHLETSEIRKAKSMPVFVGAKIAQLLKGMRKQNELDDFSFLRAEHERALLIDAIGACERIRNTPMPLVLAIKTRRFIFLFLLLLPLALVDRVGALNPLVVALASYPLFSLDEIGAELQNPFSKRNLSHLPLDTICSTIEKDVLSLNSISAEG